jgi:hypothetical protein
MANQDGRLHCRFCSYSLPTAFVGRPGSRFTNAHDALSAHVVDEHWDRLTAAEQDGVMPGLRETLERGAGWQCPKCLSLLDDGRCLNCDRGN